MATESEFSRMADPDDDSSNIRKAIHLFKSIRTKVWKLVALTMLIGLCFLVAYNYSITIAHGFYGKMTLEEFPFWSRMFIELLRDLGVGCFVAAVAGVGLEGFQQTTAIAEAEASLVARSEVLDEKMRNVIAAARNLEHHDNPLDAIKDHLKDLLPNSKFDNLSANIVELLNVLSGIRKSADTTPLGKETNEYVLLLNWMLKKYVLEGAMRLSELIRAIGPDEQQFTAVYEPPERRTLAQHILTAQMCSMREGDTYESIANVNLYLGGDYKLYREATMTALKRGISIRRIYNVCEFPDDQRVTIEEEIKSQLEQFNCPNFKARIISLADIKNITDNEVKEFNLSNRDAIKNLYFGTFKHREGGAVEFNAGPHDVSKLELKAFSQLLTSSCKSDLFEFIWQHSNTDIAPLLPRSPN